MTRPSGETVAMTRVALTTALPERVSASARRCQSARLPELRLKVLSLAILENRKERSHVASDCRATRKRTRCSRCRRPETDVVADIRLLPYGQQMPCVATKPDTKVLAE
jgi:hypothetical protein